MRTCVRCAPMTLASPSGPRARRVWATRRNGGGSTCASGVRSRAVDPRWAVLLLILRISGAGACMKHISTLYRVYIASHHRTRYFLTLDTVHNVKSCVIQSIPFPKVYHTLYLHFFAFWVITGFSLPQPHPDRQVCSPPGRGALLPRLCVLRFESAGQRVLPWSSLGTLKWPASPLIELLKQAETR